MSAESYISFDMRPLDEQAQEKMLEKVQEAKEACAKFISEATMSGEFSSEYMDRVIELQGQLIKHLREL